MLSSKNCKNSIFASISDLTDIAAEEKQKIVILRPSAFLIFRSFGHSYGRSRQKGRTCCRHAMTDFMSNVNTKRVSATPALNIFYNLFNIYFLHRFVIHAL